MNVVSSLEKTAFYFPEHTAVIDGDKDISYAQFNRDARRIASAPSRRGIRPGDHVGLCAPNAYEWLVFYFGVLECAVVGLPNKEYGERVTAFVISSKDRQPDPAELKSFVKMHLAGFKVPKVFLIVDELPKSPAGKVLKREIKKRFT